MKENKEHGHVFTSESVSEGHPDKVADRISDAILDACLKRDAHAHVACETMVGPDVVVTMGAISLFVRLQHSRISLSVTSLLQVRQVRTH